MRLFIVILALFGTYACAAENESLCNPEERYEIASHFSDFVQKVNFKYAFEDVSGMSPQNILEQVASTDNDYRDILSNFNIKSYVEGDNVVMLMCEGNSMIIEDAGCTAKVETVLACGERRACAISANAFRVCD